MSALFSLISRNTKLYFRDKSAVFFSLLTMLVIIMLYILFLGKVNTDIIKQFSRGAADVSWLINTWIMAGVIVVNSITVTLAVFGTMVRDREENLLEGFLVTPASRTKIVLGYLLSEWVVGMIMTLLTFAVAQIYIVADGGQLLSLLPTIKIIGLIALNVFSGSAMVFFIVSFIRTTKAFTALTAILGILIGFLTGVYVPIGYLPEAVQAVTKLIPATHGAALMRSVFASEASAEFFKGAPNVAVDAFNESMGITIAIGGSTVPAILMLAIIAFSALGFLGLSVLVMKKTAK